MSFTIKGEQTLVNTTPVDAVGGAKPEPEERPLEVHSIVENLAAPVRANVMQFEPKAMKIVTSEVIATATHRLGKQCGNCVHWNREQGRYLLGEIVAASARGDPQATGVLHTWRAHAIGEKHGALDPDIYTQNPNAPDVVDKYIEEFGFCRAYSEMMNDIMLQHPTETCPSDEGLQEMADFTKEWVPPRNVAPEILAMFLERHPRPAPLPIMYAPRDSQIDKLTKKLLDDVMFAADHAKKG